MQKTHQELWAECCRFIQDNIKPEQFNAWFRDIRSCSYADGKLVLEVESDFFVDQLEERFRGVLRAGVKKVYGDNISIYYTYRAVKSDETTKVSLKSTEQSPVILSQSRTAAANPFQEPAPEAFDPQLNPRYTFENYCLSESNRLARSIGEAIGDNPAIRTFNPLFVFGPPGVGKTHLIQAIGIRIKEKNPRARVLYVTARLFESQYTAVAKGNVNAFFRFYQSIDTLIIDDIQDLNNKPSTQNTFFHIFNHLRQHDRQIIMSSDRAPSEMEGFEARLLSRFKGGMQVELERPDLALRRDVLKQKSEQEGIDLPRDVAEFIASNVTQSVRELEGVMVSLMAHATVLNKEISLELARRVMANAVKVKTRKVNFEMIAEAVASFYKITPDLLFTKTRKREISDARQIVMYLAKKMVDMALTSIGKRLDRSHATVSYAIDSIESRIAIEKQLANDINCIENKVRSQN